MVLYVLAQIWKSGATIERDPQDGQLVLKNHEKVHPTVLKAAEPIFSEIDDYMKTVESLSNVDKTIWKMMAAMCGWQNNETISDFLNSDETALNLFFEYQVECTLNGWRDMYDDFFKYETEKAKQLKVEIFKHAVSFAKGGK